MATHDKNLLKLLVELSLNSELRRRLDDPVQRAAVLEEYKLKSASKRAIETSHAKALFDLAENTEVATAAVARSRKKPKATAKPKGKKKKSKK